jgi:hypothetical protein
MFTLITSIITIIWFALTKGIWIFGAYTLVRKYDLVSYVKGFISRTSV